MNETIQDGDLALLVGDDEKQHVITIQTGRRFDTHHGFVLHEAMLGRPWGSQIHTNIGYAYLMLPPSTNDLIRHIKRSSQVIFPKDSAYILMKMNIKPGAVVLESGCGSGGLTLALATAVAPTGRVYSQEIREDFVALTKRNMQKVGLDGYVTFITADSTQGLLAPEKADAVFIDVPAPHTLLNQARAALKDGGWFGSLVPTTNQIQDILRGFAAMEGERVFGMIEVEEIFTRGYKTIADRLRPRDRMIAHTGYLIFARAIIRAAHDAPPAPSPSEEEQPDSGTDELAAPDL